MFSHWAKRYAYLAQNGFSGDIVVLTAQARARRARRTVVHRMVLPACRKVRHFLDASHLKRLVADDLEAGGGLSLYVPLAPSNPLAAWCVCTIDAKREVVGLHMTVAKSRHPITGEEKAKAQVDAIRAALSTHGVVTAKAARLVFVLPAMRFVAFPFQKAKGGGELGLVWPQAQAKLAVTLDHLGRTSCTVQDVVQV